MPVRLPQPRGPVSYEVIGALATQNPGDLAFVAPPSHVDPLGGDVQLALHVCYELHYRGFAGVDADWEWDPELIRLRRTLEKRFLARLRVAVRRSDDVETTLADLAVDPVDGEGLSYYIRDSATWDECREYFVHRSIYHLKEADPQAWAIPRLHGRSKAGFVAVEFDEFGGGRADRVHATLFGNLLRAAGLDDGYLAYVDCVPPEALAIVNFMSMCGLNRGLLGAVVGHFATIEITSSPGSRRLVEGLRRLEAPEECVHFYTEHVEADAVHEQVLHEVVSGLLADEPGLASDVVFGVDASEWLEGRLAEHMRECWRGGVSSLQAVPPVLASSA